MLLTHTHCFRVTANKFFHYDYATFKSSYLMKGVAAPSTSKSSTKTKTFNKTLPRGTVTKNWVTEGYSTPIKDQGACGKDRC